MNIIYSAHARFPRRASWRSFLIITGPTQELIARFRQYVSTTEGLELFVSDKRLVLTELSVWTLNYRLDDFVKEIGIKCEETKISRRTPIRISWIRGARYAAPILIIILAFIGSNNHNWFLVTIFTIVSFCYFAVGIFERERPQLSVFLPVIFFLFITVSVFLYAQQQGEMGMGGLAFLAAIPIALTFVVYSGVLYWFQKRK